MNLKKNILFDIFLQDGQFFNAFLVVELPDPRQYDTIPMVHFDFEIERTNKLLFIFSEWWNDEDSDR